MHHRSELYEIYQKFIAMGQTQFSCLIKIFHTDNAEYKEIEVLQTFAQNGTVVQPSCPGTSQQNGCAECKYRHILDLMRALLFSASYPKRFWREAALTTIYTINRASSAILDNIFPYECLFGTISTVMLCVYLIMLVLYFCNHMSKPN